MVPLQVLFAFGIAMMLARARRGVGFFRTVFYLPALAPPVAATLGFVYILNPATGPVNTCSRTSGSRGRSGSSRRRGRSRRSSLLALWGIGNTMIIFLAAVLDVPRHLYESAELDGAGRVAAAALGDAADDQPGDPLRGRPRRDPGAAVLHAGVRRGRRSRPARRRRRATSRRQPRLPARTRRSSTPCSSTSTASTTSRWATRRRWRCSCSASRSR